MLPHWLRFLVLVSMGTASTTGADAISVLGEARVEPGRSTATVRWTTDAACGATVRYGLSPGQLDHKGVGGVGTSHAVSLTGLQAGTTYYYSIGTARRPLATGQFTTPGEREKSPTPAAQTAARPAAGSQAERVAPSPPAAAVTSSLRPPPTSVSWANPASLPDHFARHGPDFRAKNPDDYAAQAWRFLQRGKTEGLPAKQDPNGTLRVWDARTGAFAAYTPDGRTKTYFKPNSPDYFQRQPGRAVRLKSDPNSR